ncbi:SCO0607 family lipoprotein [Streptomyces sp. NPDC053367]|uniref:SCO0607 family lipoprotein n=1 Tax=Streptomyces sp. NPDC053367 TaxID=3365700 RepID=UPI0037D1335C
MSTPLGIRRTRTTRAALPPRGLRTAGAVLVGAAAVVALTGCSALEYREEQCMSDHYPVLAVNNTGADCVPDGEQPPAGYARYPEGKVPRYVGDEWDVYWSTHTLDEHGEIIDAPGTP